MLKKKIIYINKKYFTKNIRIDKYLFNYFKKKKISRKKIQNNIKIGNVLLNNKKIKKNNKLNINDKIIFFYIKDFFYKKRKNYIYKNKNIKINIHYEDNDILIINKQPGLIVHPGHGNYKNTLINWLKYYFLKKKINNLNYLNYRFGLLHRLDKNTSGLLIIAKNINSYNNLRLQFLNKKIKKKYIALVWGKPRKNNNIIKNYIGRNIKNRIKMRVYSNKKYGKLAITKYKIIKNYKFLTLIKCIIKTGRTHQIRVHFNYIGNPIFNDDIYGGNKILYNFNKFYNKFKYTNIINNCFNILQRQALHAYSLTIKHPTTKKKIKFITDIPNDIKYLINYLNLKK
ncbi:RluA family pseudouridine synthase [Candidatus Shikimatogenerans bostrichidophilus]|uniref:RluA family pseudouridine synthase n=1 Tax=Candidatus Shikimatogenerans bostrichidophilus TaxID=2943807 RepID=UPI002966D2A1